MSGQPELIQEVRVIVPVAGVADSTNPTGEVGTAPDAATDLAVDFGSTTADLTWTLPEGATATIYRRDVTAAGSFVEIADEIAVGSYNATSLTPENEYQFKITLTNAYGTSGDSNVVSGTTEATASGTITITPPDGQNFGTGPTVVLFDRFVGSHLDAITDGREADVGEWTAVVEDSGATCRLYYDAETDRTWLARRDPNALMSDDRMMTSLYKFLNIELKEFRFSQRRWIPDGTLFPSATVPDSLSGVPSSDKPTWFGFGDAEDLTGIGAPYANIVVDSHSGGGAFYIGGNSSGPAFFSGYQQSIYTGWSFVRPTFTTWYQSGMEDSGDTGGYTLIGDSIVINGEDNVREVRDIDAIANADITFRYYNAVKAGGWYNSDGDGDYANILPLMGDFYLAIGANSRACLIVSDNAVLTSSNEAYIIPPASWASGEIQAALAEWEDMGEDLHVHAIKADGTLYQDLDFVRAE